MTLPVSLEQAKAQLRILGDDGRDDEILGFIRDAAAWVENYTGQMLEARDVEEPFRAPARAVSLSAWPIYADAVLAVSFAGSSGIESVAGLSLDASRRPARILASKGWPTYDPELVFTAKVRAGYEDPADVPRNMCRAILILIAAYDDDREGGDTLAKAEATATRLCRSFKRHLL